MRPRRFPPYVLAFLAAAALLAAGPAGARAAEVAPVPPDEGGYEYSGKRGGLRVGSWSVTSDEMSGSDTEDALLLEGFYEKDLDVRLSIESTAALWRREVSASESGGLLGSSSYESEMWVLPMFTSLKFYPVRHERPLAPFISAGIGVAVVKQDTEIDGLGFSEQDEGTSMHFGYGYNGSAGLDWNVTGPFGFTFMARYQNLFFQEEIAGDESLKGWVYSGGFVYRFQQKRRP